MTVRPASRAALRWLVVAAGLLVIAGQGVVIAHRRSQQVGDFDVSREFGRRFLAGEHLYAGGLHYPYMPTAAFCFAPLAMVDARIAFVLRYVVALGALWLTFRLLEGMLARRIPRVSTQRFAIAVATLILGAHPVIRDLDDGGPHLILLAMLVIGLACAERSRLRAAAAWFGLAGALKAPAALLLPYFVLKRRWRLAVYTGIATLTWMVLPALWMGGVSWWAHQREWAGAAAGSIIGDRLPIAEASEQRIQNQALRPVLERYLEMRPEDPMWTAVHSPVVVSSSRTAHALASIVIMLLLAGLGWLWRQLPSQSPDPMWLPEASAVLILALLLSPATWVQHLVLLLPGLYLIVAQHCAIAPLPRSAIGVMAAYAVLALALNREVLGKASYLALLAHGVHTLCLLLVLAVLVVCRPTATATAHT